MFSNKMMQDPEVMELVTQHMKKYWESWIYESIPALGGLTPIEAAKTNEGRKKLEALLKSYEQGTKLNSNDPSHPDVEALRKMLGL